VLEVVVHAGHVVTAGQLVGKRAELAAIGVLDPTATRSDLHALALVQAVEDGVGPNFFRTSFEAKQAWVCGASDRASNVRADADCVQASGSAHPDEIRRHPVTS
jgi:hypothetical protein